MALARTYRREQAGTRYPSSQQPSSTVSRARPLQLPVEGLPRLGRRSLLRVTPFGDRLVIADGNTVETFAILRENSRAVARRVGQATLPGRVRDLLVAPDGATFALTQCDAQEVGIVRIDADRAFQLRVLKALPTAAVATRRHLVFAVSGDDLTPPQLLALRSRDGHVVWREPLASARVRLRAGRDEELLIAAPGSRQIRWIDVSRRLDRCRTPNDRPRPTDPGRDRDPQEDPEKPCCCPPGQKPDDSDRDPYDGPPPSRRLQRFRRGPVASLQSAFMCHDGLAKSQHSLGRSIDVEYRAVVGDNDHTRYQRIERGVECGRMKTLHVDQVRDRDRSPHMPLLTWAKYADSH